jgi:hypothetical protein
MRAFSATLKFTLQRVRKHDDGLSKTDSHSFRAIRCPGVGKGLLKELPLAHVDIIVSRSLGDQKGGGHVLGGHGVGTVCHLVVIST